MLHQVVRCGFSHCVLSNAAVGEIDSSCALHVLILLIKSEAGLEKECWIQDIPYSCQFQLRSRIRYDEDYQTINTFSN